MNSLAPILRNPLLPRIVAIVACFVTTVTIIVTTPTIASGQDQLDPIDESADAGQRPAALNTLPGRIQAENYDIGGPGIAYRDTDRENAGGIRSGDWVDVYTIENSGADGSLVGRTRTGEWLEYTVSVEQPADFVVSASVASGSERAGIVAIEVNGQLVGSVNGTTDGWFDWRVRPAGRVALNAGQHVVRLLFPRGGDINVDWFDFSSVDRPAPICAKSQQAEDADVRGRFVVVDDRDANGGRYAVVPKGSGGWFRGPSDDYVEFCLGVDVADWYSIEATVRAPGERDNSFFVSVDGGPVVDFVADVSGDAFVVDAVNDAPSVDPLHDKLAVTETVDTQVWFLEPGDHLVRFYVRRDGAQLDDIRVVPSPVDAGPTMTWPVDGQLTSGFGLRWGRLHAGIDIGARPGTPIMAPLEGTVSETRVSNAGYGNHVIIDHGDGLTTLYAHLSVIGVEVGQAVDHREVIGEVGNTGMSTGPHLHFEVRVDGIAVDPLTYLSER